jgi:hypothetical protein
VEGHLESVHRKTRRVRLAPNILYPILISIVTCVILSISTIFYATAGDRAKIAAANRAASQAQKAADDAGRAIHGFCTLVKTLDYVYQQGRPATPIGKLVAQEMHDLVQTLSCQKTVIPRPVLPSPSPSHS